MRAIICGGRAFRDEALMDEVLSGQNLTCVIEGGYSGADSLARDWGQ